VHVATSTNPFLSKSSGSNDAVHHVNLALRQTTAFSGTTNILCIQFVDGVTNQCCVVFRSDGALLLTSGSQSGSTLATWATAIIGVSVWHSYEIEVVVNNSTGSIAVRRNGNTSNDFSATGLNTRGGTANNYANKVQLGSTSGSFVQDIDDFLWRSDASSVSWIGDVRAAQMMPASDASVQFSKGPSTYALTPYSVSTTFGNSAGTARYSAFTASYDGTIASVIINLGAGFTGNMKLSLFASSDSSTTSVPTTVLGSATTITNPATGNNTFVFSSPPSVIKGTRYYVGVDTDTSSGTIVVGSQNNNLGLTSATAYGSFPAAGPSVGSSTGMPLITVNHNVGSNATLVNESQENTTTDYVYDSTVGHADFYNISTIPTSSTVTAVTTRGYLCKSDVGVRSAQLQLASGVTTVQSTPLLLSTSFQWAYRTDTVDPNTGSAWSASNVNSITIGPLVTS
jgi:hypothetical protein